MGPVRGVAWLGSPRLRWPRRIAVALVAGWLALACAWWLAVRVVGFPAARLDKTAATSLTVDDANGALLRQEATSAGLREHWVPLELISPYLIAATLASEDN